MTPAPIECLGIEWAEGGFSASFRPCPVIFMGKEDAHLEFRATAPADPLMPMLVHVKLSRVSKEIPFIFEGFYSCWGVLGRPYLVWGYEYK